MRVTPAVLSLAALLTTAACSDDPSADREAGPEHSGAAVEEGAAEHTYPEGDQITVDLTMDASGEGGRSTPFFSGYRPTIEFDHLDQSVECAVQLPIDLDQFRPGETHMVALLCADDVAVHVDATVFTLLEARSERGRGDVIFTY